MELKSVIQGSISTINEFFDFFTNRLLFKILFLLFLLLNFIGCIIFSVYLIPQENLVTVSWGSDDYKKCFDEDCKHIGDLSCYASFDTQQLSDICFGSTSGSLAIQLYPTISTDLAAGTAEQNTQLVLTSLFLDAFLQWGSEWNSDFFDATNTINLRVCQTVDNCSSCIQDISYALMYNLCLEGFSLDLTIQPLCYDLFINLDNATNFPCYTHEQGISTWNSMLTEMNDMITDCYDEDITDAWIVGSCYGSTNVDRSAEEYGIDFVTFTFSIFDLVLGTVLIANFAATYKKRKLVEKQTAEMQFT